MRKHRNIALQLACRESSLTHLNSNLSFRRRLYSTLPLDKAVHAVRCPVNHVFRFTPDGRYLICASQDCRAVELYRFTGWPILRANDNRTVTFESVFALVHSIRLCSGDAQISKTVCLLLQERGFLVLCSSTPPAETQDEEPRHDRPSASPLCEKTSVHLVDMEGGRELDRFTLQNDFVHLSFTSSVSLYGSLLAVLSARKQCVHLLRVTRGGTLLHVLQLGRYCNDDDELIVQQHRAATLQPPSAEEGEGTQQSTQHSGSQHGSAAWRHGSTQHDDGDNEHSGAHGMIQGLWHRLLVHLYKRAVHDSGGHHATAHALRQFYRGFESHSSLCIHKVHVLDEQHILLGLGLPTSQPNAAQTLFLAIYHIQQTRIVSFWRVNSQQLLSLYTRCAAALHDDGNLTAWQRSLTPPITPFLAALQNMTDEERGARLRLLQALPAICQLANYSPYLDPRIFTYDDSSLALTLPPRHLSPVPITFSHAGARSTHAFALQPPPQALEPQPPPQPHEPSAAAARRSACFVVHHFHPVLPLALAIVQSRRMPMPMISIYFHG